jgi:hypothetical protein
MHPAHPGLNPHLLVISLGGADFYWVIILASIRGENLILPNNRYPIEDHSLVAQRFVIFRIEC